MKICPTCQQTYADDALNFCLSDGAVLITQGNNAEPQKTVFMNQPALTNPNRQDSNPTAVPGNWGIISPVAAQPKPKSRTWLWVLGIFGAVILLCGGGFVALIAIVANNDNKNTSVNILRNTNVITVNNNAKPKNALTDDLSDWTLPDDNLGITDYQNKEFYMTSKSGGYYFVLMSGDKNFQTDNATARVTVRNTTGKPTDSGYGLMVHNNIAVALAQDYSFLIDTVKQAYRVAKHQSRKENVVVKWTNESAIKSGSQENLLEVRDNGGKMSFYINGKFITTVTDSDGIKSGVPGLYASGAIPIAFSNLQVEK